MRNLTSAQMAGREYSETYGVVPIGRMEKRLHAQHMERVNRRVLAKVNADRAHRERVTLGDVQCAAAIMATVAGVLAGAAMCVAGAVYVVRAVFF